MTLLPFRTSSPLMARMFSIPRTITLLAICALGLAAVAPVAATAAPADEEYVLELPSAGDNPEGAGGSGGSGGGGSSNAAAAAVDSADEGGLPILLVVLAGTALAGASIAIMRRQRT